MARTPRDVTERELAVLEVLWNGGATTIRQLTEVLYPGGRTAHYATVQTLLHRLEAKGCVRRERVCYLPSHHNKAQIYLAAIDRDELIGRRLRDMAEQLCGGSLTPLLTHLMRTRQFTAVERRELRLLIDDLDREKGKGKGDAR
ncbi:MAG TPA: penicillinase repressor [Planctomycetales bacterium]|jgi:predicted transcriptional regulator|nr:penicillinase repressor [Planctomycetales bacterium]